MIVIYSTIIINITNIYVYIVIVTLFNIYWTVALPNGSQFPVTANFPTRWSVRSWNRFGFPSAPACALESWAQQKNMESRRTAGLM